MTNEFDPDHTLTMLIHAEPGLGKTPVALTAPGRVLVLDVENGTKFATRGRVKTTWDPQREQPPKAGEWSVCVVQCRDWPTFMAVLEYLKSGKHCFRSVVLDTLTELQKRCKDIIVSQSRGSKLEQQGWGTLLDDMEVAIRELRDTTSHPTNPVQCVVLTAQTVFKDGMFRPAVQGGLSTSLPSFVDVVAYLGTDDTAENTASASARKMLIQPMAEIVAKDRTSASDDDGLSGTYGAVVKGPISIPELIAAVYAE